MTVNSVVGLILPIPFTGFLNIAYHYQFFV